MSKNPIRDIMALRVAYTSVLRETELALTHLDGADPIQAAAGKRVRKAMEVLAETEQRAFVALAGGR